MTDDLNPDAVERVAYELDDRSITNPESSAPDTGSHESIQATDATEDPVKPSEPFTIEFRIFDVPEQDDRQPKLEEVANTLHVLVPVSSENFPLVERASISVHDLEVLALQYKVWRGKIATFETMAVLPDADGINRIAEPLLRELAADAAERYGDPDTLRDLIQGNIDGITETPNPWA